MNKSKAGGHDGNEKSLDEASWLDLP